MATLAPTFRVLYSTDAPFGSKLEAAEQLVEALLDGSGAGELPPLVRSHYLRSLLEWACGVLTKKSEVPTGGKDKKVKKRKQQQANGGVPAAAADPQQKAAQPPKLQPRCWGVLAAVLGSSSTPASQPVPAALLPAVTTALQLLHEAQLPEVQSEALLCQLADVLRLLGGKLASSFRPSIEHAVGAAEAALTGQGTAAAAAGSGRCQHAEAWQAVAAAAARLLLAAASGHPNQRKVWDSSVPRLLPLLATAAFPPSGSQGSGSNADAGGESELSVTCRRALEAVLFNPQHVAPLAAAAAAEMAAALAGVPTNGEAAAPATAPVVVEEGDNVDGGGAKETQQQQQQQQGGGNTALSVGYAAQLFTAIQGQVAAGELPLAALPWMAGRFCAALRQHRRAAETEAAITIQAGRREQPQAAVAEDGEGGGEAAAAAGRKAASLPASGGTISVSADFHFWLALLRTLLPRVEQLQNQAAGGAPLAEAVRGVSGLSAVLQQYQLYRPTQDPAGQQRALLQMLATGALQLALSQQGEEAQQAVPAPGVLPAALAVLQGILAVEHRVIQEQLPVLWPLLLWAPEASAASAAAGGDDGGTAGGGGVAAAVACSLVTAFAELRQLEVLLRYLTAALLQPQQAQHAGAPTAAAAVMHSSRFQAALAAAVRQLPSGQIPTVLRLAAEGVAQLGSSGGSSGGGATASGDGTASTGGPGQVLVLDLHSACLASLAVDLTTAGAAGTAARALVETLSPLLLPLLAAAAGQGGGGSKKDKSKGKGHAELLPALLRLYRQALAVHDRCAALHPEVAPLAGRHAQRPRGVAPAAPLAGYFAPLLLPDGDAARAPGLGQLLEAARDGEGTAGYSSSLRLALLQAAGQQLQLRHSQMQYLTRTCPVTLLPAAGAEEEAGGEEARQRQQLEQQQQQQRQLAEERQLVESELRQLSDSVAGAAVIGAAAGEPAALQLAGEALPILQEWAAQPLLLSLLEACLGQAVPGAAADGAQQAQQQLCRQVLVGGELLEQRRLANLLPSAAASVLASSLSAAFVDAAAGEGPEQGQGQNGSAKKKHKKGRKSEGHTADAGEGSGHLAALLQQLACVAEGKETEPGAWADAVTGSCASIAALAAAAAAPGASNGDGSSKKRKQRAVGDGQTAPASALLAVQRQAELLSQLPLGYLQPEAAAGMATVAIGALLCCWQGSFALGERQVLAGTALPAAAACLALLGSVAAFNGSINNGSSSASGASHLAGQMQQLEQVLHAALLAAGSTAGASNGASNGGGSGAAVQQQQQQQQQQVAATVAHCRNIMQAACAASLAASADGAGSRVEQLAGRLCQGLACGQQEEQWAAAVLAHACLAACHAAAARNTGSSRATADILCAGSSQPQPAEASSSAAAAAISAASTALDAAVSAALPRAAAAAQGSGDSWQQALLAGSLYSCSAQLLRLRCLDHPVADTLARQQQAGGSTALTAMSAGLQAAAALLGQVLPAEPVLSADLGGSAPGQAAQAAQASALVLVSSLLEYVAACCCVTGRMRPAASSSHYASLMALLLHLLARQPPVAAAPIPPVRHTVPFAAAFPAAAAEVAAAALPAGTAGTAVRPLLLGALRELVAGSSSQQLLLPLRFAEAALPAAGLGGSCASLALPLCELLLVLLEATAGSQQQRLLGQHCDRVAALLTSWVTTTAYSSTSPQQQQQLSVGQLAAAILAAGAESGSMSAVAGLAASPAQDWAPATPAAAAAPPAAGAPQPAQNAALCTALRALESLAARPKLFPLPPTATSSMLSAVCSVWTAYAEHAQQPLRQAGGSAGAAALPGFHFCLDASTGAGLFSGSCHLLTCMLRHRQQELRRCLPLLLQSLHSLLRFLAAAELSAKLKAQALHPLAGAGAGSRSGGLRGRGREQGWRVKCAELLAGVLAELAGLKDAGIGRYCPQLLADYLLLAAAPPSTLSKATLHFSSPAAAALATGSHSLGGAWSSGGEPAAGSIAAAAASAAAAAAVAAAAEEDALAGEPLSEEAGAALRRGAFALYGACSAPEIQFLYSSLGAAGGAAGDSSGPGGGAGGGGGALASWRAALASLKSDYEKNYKYTGKV